ncbi:phi LC3 family holin [Bacillus pakistanensis]|uniref:Phi LC3 family holin n=1 Tax=Rossellomorea pakistanensis TaxID=992288 RepID=A0ABS2NDN4_9BACI|nr:phage holin [Bacillus pakistanensis]MBM7585859.1 phi LC3 family holin [Bacillus pakistanensis]
MINWGVRFKNKLWVIAVISQLFILAEVLLVGAHAIGLTDFQFTEEIKGWVLAAVNAIFGVLASLGVVQDPTTESLSDSDQARLYKKPRSDIYK